MKLDITPLIRQYGTPLWVLDVKHIEDAIKTFKCQVPGISIELPNKAIGWPQAVREMLPSIDGIMISSDHEAKVLSAHGVPYRKITYWGVGRTSIFFSSIIKKGVGRIVFDGMEEVDCFKHSLRNITHVPQLSCSIRVAPIGPTNDGYLGRGIELDSALRAVDSLSSLGICDVGLAYHADVMQVDPDKWASPRKQILLELAKIKKRRHDLIHVDLGGGIPPLSLLGEWGFKPYFADLLRAKSSVRLIACPGRALIADAGTAISTIISKRENYGVKCLIVDIGANTIVPLPSSRFIVDIPKRKGDDKCIVCDSQSSFGIYSHDTFVSFDSVQLKDVVIIRRSGAYTWSMRSSAVFPVCTGILSHGHEHIICVANKKEG